MPNINLNNTHPRVVAHDPVEVVRVKVVHPELERPQRQTVEVTPAPQSVHHESHHERQVRQERRKPCRHRQAQLYKNVLDRNLLCAVVKLAELRQQQWKERVDLLGSQVRSRRMERVNGEQKGKLDLEQRRDSPDVRVYAEVVFAILNIISSPTTCELTPITTDAITQHSLSDYL